MEKKEDFEKVKHEYRIIRCVMKHRPSNEMRF